MAVDPILTTQSLAEEATKLAMSTDGLIKLALWTALLAISATVSLALYLIRTISKLAVTLDRLAHRPCMAGIKDIQDFIEFRTKKGDTP
jgi:hypothetical protein